MISNAYRQTLIETHAKSPRWGTSARKHRRNVESLINAIGAKTVLDYGCGKGELFKTITPKDMHEISMFEYDPGIVGKDVKPAGKFELVCCLDVMEHIEIDYLPKVMDHLCEVIGKVGFFVISTRHASGMLSDGRNAHLIVKPAEWWFHVFSSHFDRIDMQVNQTRAEAYMIVASDDYDGEIKAVCDPNISK